MINLCMWSSIYPQLEWGSLCLADHTWVNSRSPLIGITIHTKQCHEKQPTSAGEHHALDPHYHILCHLGETQSLVKKRILLTSRSTLHQSPWINTIFVPHPDVNYLILDWLLEFTFSYWILSFSHQCMCSGVNIVLSSFMIGVVNYCD